MLEHRHLASSTIRSMIRAGAITLGGNRKLRIYGKLSCKSGRRLHVNNRVFFASEPEAKAAGFRPCAHCMNTQYQDWKDGTLRNNC